MKVSHKYVCVCVCELSFAKSRVASHFVGIFVNRLVLQPAE